MRIALMIALLAFVPALSLPVSASTPGQVAVPVPVPVPTAALASIVPGPILDSNCSGTAIYPTPHNTDRRTYVVPGYNMVVVHVWVGSATPVSVPAHDFTWTGGCVLWSDVLGCQRDNINPQVPMQGCRAVNAIVGTLSSKYDPEMQNVVNTGTSTVLQSADDVICNFNTLGIMTRWNGNPC